MRELNIQPSTARAQPRTGTATQWYPDVRHRALSVGRLIFPLSILVVFFLLSSCRPTTETGSPAQSLDPSAFSGQRALDEARLLVEVGPRDAGTPGAATAAEHLAARLREAGVETDLDTFTEDTSLGTTTFHNVIGTVPGSGPDIVIVGSHFDTKSGMPDGFEGANDSASSSGALVELARVVSAHAEETPLPFEVRFAFFDGEECRVAYGPRDGFHGSRRCARRLVESGEASRVKGVLVLDMIGDRDLNLTLPRNADPQLLATVFAAARDEGMRSSVALAPFAIGDDHVPFLEEGIPAVDIIDFEFGSAPGLNDYWHTGEDTMDKISAESLESVGRLTLGTLQRLMGGRRSGAGPVRR